MAKGGSTMPKPDLTIYSEFDAGYRNREDTSLLKPQTLVAGSHDVLTTVTGRVGIRKGYTIDGEASMVQAGIESSFDWQTQTGFTHHLRAGFLTSAGNDGKLQIRWEDDDGVQWLDLLTGLESSNFNFTSYWDDSRTRAYLLFVNGSEGIWEWRGGITSVASAAATTVTTSGTQTFEQLGFRATGDFIAGGVTYTYTGGASTTTLTGVTPDPSAIPAGTPMYQTATFTPVGNLSFNVTPVPPTGFTFDLISQLNNQVFFASTGSNLLYMSVAGDYTDYDQSTARLQYEGDMFTTQGSVRALVPEDSRLYVSAGLDEWYYTQFTQTIITDQVNGTTLTYENAELERVKTTAQQAARSQHAVSKIKNNIVFLSNEPILNSFGTVENFLNSPQIVDLSFPIVNDMDSYDFEGAQVFFSRKFVYLSVPRESLFRMYNMTNPANPYWEAPQTVQLSCFSQLEDGRILGHSASTSESYVLFSGFVDRAETASDAGSTGVPISANAVFAFQTSGERGHRKSFDKFFLEGYMSTNTELEVGLTYRSPSAGLSPSQTLEVQGNQPYVLGQGNDNSLGKFPFGKMPLGADSDLLDPDVVPYYFAVIRTATRVPHLAYQPSVSSYGIGQRWEILSFGTNTTLTTELPTDITV